MEDDLLSPEKARKLTREVTDKLQEKGIECCVVGGVAFSLLQHPRSTKDIDICARKEEGCFTSEEVLELKEMFKDDWILDESSSPDALTLNHKNGEEFELEIYVNSLQDAGGSVYPLEGFWDRVQVIDGIPTCSKKDLIYLKSQITDQRPYDVSDIQLLMRSSGEADSHFDSRRQRTISRRIWMDDYRSTYNEYGKIPRGYFKRKAEEYGVHHRTLYNYLVGNNVHKPKRRRSHSF